MDISHPAARSDSTKVNILLIGLGSIGTIYGYLLEKVSRPRAPTWLFRRLPPAVPPITEPIPSTHRQLCERRAPRANTDSRSPDARG